ncbi:serine carboxypeptidase S28-domain-containing protein [Ephemerocybe angulata]|uniref:Serine carboxypeptidase S28-domain-containing protein n=1 Tax=Ephemerocybe angulata TaxID=980116 RepID=A0A8H6MAH8_9AGAR|nr:serine carboxypeptidase S28-domain-containing protein [Tulosesus angulatus]
MLSRGHPSFWSLTAALPLIISVLTCTCTAKFREDRVHGNMRRMPDIPVVSLGARASAPVMASDGTELPDYNTVYYFDQLIDHNRPSLGTFKQRYWHTWEYYQPGGPIVLSTPGRSQCRITYLTNMTIMGMIAQETKGATVVLEHRFYGESNPYPDLSVESLRVHTIQQAIDDLAYFAENVVLPMPGGDKVPPYKAPWIYAGGSYAGALASWTMVSKPNLFFAAYSSSGVVQAKVDFWEYFEPIRENMPKNCSSDVQAALTRLDAVFTSGNATAIADIKKTFGLSELTNSIDFLGALRNNLWDWQQLQPNTGSQSIFYRFCDQIQVKAGVPAPPGGWGAEYAITAWGKFWRREYYPYLCGIDDPETCLGTANPSAEYWTATATNNRARSWFWTVCNELGYLQNAAPEGKPSLVSRLIQPSYDLRQCQLMFPQAFSKTPTPRAELINLLYKGWNVKLDRIIFVNGARDPWRDATMSAQSHQPRTSSLQQVHLTQGFHCSDLTADNALDPTIADVHRKTVQTMKTWLKAYRPSPRPPRPYTPPRPPVSGPHKAPPSTPPRKIKKTNAWMRGGQ